MVDLEMLKKLRAAGVKRAGFTANGEILDVTFFPTIPPIDTDSLFPPSERATEPPPAPGEETPVPVQVAPAMARILRRGSVS